MVLLWGSNWAVMKTGLKIVDPLNFVMQRLFISSFVLMLLMLYFKAKVPRDKKTWLFLLGLAIINVISMALTNAGLVYETAGIGSVLTYTQPLFVFGLAVFFLGEGISIKRIVGVILGFLGVVLLYVGRNSSNSFLSYPVLLLLSGAFLWGVTMVYYKKFLSHVDPIVTNLFVFLMGAIFLSAVTFGTEEFSFSPTVNYVSALLYNAIAASAVGWTLWVFLIKEEDTTVVAASSLIVPLVAFVFGWLLLNETLEPESFIGLALILVGVYLVNQKLSNKKTKML